MPTSDLRNFLFSVFVSSFLVSSFHHFNVRSRYSNDITTRAWSHSNKFETPTIPLKSFNQKFIRPLCTFSALFTIYQSREPVKADEIRVYPKPRSSQRPLVYSVEMTNPPSLLPRTQKGEENVAKRFAAADMVILGEHHYSELDHNLEANIISKILKNKSSERKIVIGLEMVEQQFQSALDRYVNDKDSPREEAEGRLFRESEWESRWAWDFEGYLPIFRTAKENGLKLIALGLPSEIKSKLKEKGLDGLTEEEKNMYLLDSEGFVESVKPAGFVRYTNKVIASGFEFSAANNLLGRDPSVEKYFATRIFEDEAIACAAAKVLVTHIISTGH